jgi:hypothetical protein
MAYNTKAIKTDVNAKPIPQLYNPVTDEYEVLQGTGGAARQVLYGPDGQPISTTEGKLAVRAAELETILSSQSTAAKQEALMALVGAIDAAAVSDPAAAGAVIALLKGVLSRLQALGGKLDGITDGTTPAKTKTQLTDGPDGNPIATTEGKLAVRAEEIETLLTALKEKDFATQATLATVLERLQAVEGKIDGITDGTTPATTQLMGSKVKNAFEIIPDDATDLPHETIAVYIGFDGDLKVDLVGGDTVTMYNLAAGAWHPIQAKRVYATGTTATYILGAY